MSGKGKMTKKNKRNGGTSLRKTVAKNAKAVKDITKVSKMRGPIKTFSSQDPFKPYYDCKLQYAQTFDGTTNAVNTWGTDQIFRLNSLYDPDETGVGHQPYGFDQLALLYRRYKVSAVLVEIIARDPLDEGCYIGMQVIPPSGTGNLVGKTLDEIKERPMCAVRGIPNTGSQKVYLKQWIPIQTVSGLSPIQFKANSEDFTASVSGSPNSIPRLQLATLNNKSTASNFTLTVKLTFYAMFYDRIIQNQS